MVITCSIVRRLTVYGEVFLARETEVVYCLGGVGNNGTEIVSHDGLLRRTRTRTILVVELALWAPIAIPEA